MREKLKIISTDLLDAYQLQSRPDMEALFEGLQDAAISTDTFSFYTSLGLEYPELDYNKALPFLLMLPEALTI